MGYTTSGLNDAVNGVAAASTWISAHTGDPSTNGANEVTGGSYARQQTTWAAASSGSRAGSQVTIPIPAATAVTYWGIWSAQSGGTFKGGFQLSGGGESFTNAGNLLHTPTISAS